MSTATYRDFDLRRGTARMPKSAPACARPRHGFFRRIFAAIERSLQRRAEEEAGLFIANHGGRITDDVERQLNEYFGGRGFPPYEPPRSWRRTAGLFTR